MLYRFLGFFFVCFFSSVYLYWLFLLSFNEFMLFLGWGRRIFCSLSCPFSVLKAPIKRHGTVAPLCIPTRLLYLPKSSPFKVWCFFQAFASFPECSKDTVQKGFNLPVDLNYFPPHRAVYVLLTCIIFCTVYNKRLFFFEHS